MMCWSVIQRKPDTGYKNKLRVESRIFLVSVAVFLCSKLLPQELCPADSATIIPSPVEPVSTANIRLSYNPGIRHRNSTLIAPFAAEDKKTLQFLDSLKARASKTLVTRKLYDIIVTSPASSPAKYPGSSGENVFTDVSGKIIRNVQIKKLEVFGTSINLPDHHDPNGLERFLNKTHVNTNEFIIRKNLLFSAGDTVSALKLSDNERIIRQLPYIDDARIIPVYVSDEEVDIVVVTKDVYSLGAEVNLRGIKKGSLSLFEKNIFGMGHEFGITVPHDAELPDSPGFGVKYLINNISRTFINTNLFYFNGLGERTYGFDISRSFVSSFTKYAGGISFRHMHTSEDLDTLVNPEPLKYNVQDYWLARSFLLDKQSVTRLVIGARYYNNNVFDHPFILPDSYHSLQKYKIFLGSLSISSRKYYKSNLVYGYGHTEDIPTGGLINITAGREMSEFKNRYYTGINISLARSISKLGYISATTGFASFHNNGKTEQGFLLLRTKYISRLISLGNYRVRNFLYTDYSRGFDRYSNEYLSFNYEHGFSGFRNDSISGNQRLSLSLESVIFSPFSFYGFKFAFFGFADFGFLSGSNQVITTGHNLSSLGVGVRIGNDNLVFKTFQIRLGYFPGPPDHSRINYLLISGEARLKPDNFEPAQPSIIQYR